MKMKTKTVFKCDLIGCRKICFNERLFVGHKEQHLTNFIENNAVNNHFFKNKIKPKIMVHKNDFKSNVNYRGLESLKRSYY
jgi:hypothetical protein